MWACMGCKWKGDKQGVLLTPSKPERWASLQRNKGVRHTSLAPHKTPHTRRTAKTFDNRQHRQYNCTVRECQKKARRCMGQWFRFERTLDKMQGK